MREVKFRVWDDRPEVQGYLDTDSVFLMANGSCLIDDVGDVIDMSTTTIEQYTGMIDANGVKVYEGDIVQSEASAIQIVVGIKAVYIYKGVYTLVQATKSQSDEIFILDSKDIVIGNIHEDKELLGER